MTYTLWHGRPDNWAEQEYHPSRRQGRTGFGGPPTYSVAPNCSVNCVRGPMLEPFRPMIKFVMAPDGSPFTIADLPAPGTKRWSIRRKAEVVAAVRGGLLSLEEACGRYTLTVDEFLSWQFSIDQHGLAGLRTTRIQQYRQ